MTAVPIDAEASYEQWIGLLYACAVFRGVLAHPPPWLASTPAIGYVHRVELDPAVKRGHIGAGGVR